jgi:YD repeat-containing protein
MATPGQGKPMQFSMIGIRERKKARHEVLSVFALLTILALGPHCAKKYASLNYYRHAYLDERYNITGKYPVSADLASRINCYRFAYNKNGELVKIDYLKEGRNVRDPLFRTAQITIVRKKGFEERIFQNAEGKPSRNSFGVYVTRIKVDSGKNPVQLTHLDREGKLMENNRGVATHSWSLDEKGRKIKAILLDRSGSQITDSRGHYELRYRYDEGGNIVEMSNHGEKGELLMNNSGIAIIRQRFDDHRNLIEQKYLSSAGKLAENRDGFAIVRMKYDDMGNVIEQSHFGADEKLKEVREGVAIWRMEYDERGRILKTTTLDEKGKKIKEYE